MKDTTRFKLVGLSRPKASEGQVGSVIGTCEPLRREDTFKAEFAFPEDLKGRLWKYATGDWKDKKIAIVEHDGLYADGTPINPIIVNIELANAGDLMLWNN